MKMFVVGVLLFAAMQTHASEVDYVSYMERVDQFTELAVSAKSCEKLE